MQGELGVTHAYCRVLTVGRKLITHMYVCGAGTQMREILDGDERDASLNPSYDNPVREATEMLKMPLMEALDGE